MLGLNVLLGIIRKALYEDFSQNVDKLYFITM